MSGQLSQRAHFVAGIYPIADFNDGTKYSDVVNMKGYSGATFVVMNGVATGGTASATITMLAGSDAADPPTASTAIPFHYKVITATDVEGPYAMAATTGFATTAGSAHMYIIEVEAEELGDTGYNYLCMKFVEAVNDPVVGSVLIILHRGRYQQDVPATALT